MSWNLVSYRLCAWFDPFGTLHLVYSQPSSVVYSSTPPSRARSHKMSAFTICTAQADNSHPVCSRLMLSSSNSDECLGRLHSKSCMAIAMRIDSCQTAWSSERAGCKGTLGKTINACQYPPMTIIDSSNSKPNPQIFKPNICLASKHIPNYAICNSLRSSSLSALLLALWACQLVHLSRDLQVPSWLNIAENSPVAVREPVALPDEEQCQKMKREDADTFYATGC